MSRRPELAKRALELAHVWSVQERLTATENLRPLVVTDDTEARSAIGS